MEFKQLDSKLVLAIEPMTFPLRGKLVDRTILVELTCKYQNTAQALVPVRIFFGRSFLMGDLTWFLGSLCSKISQIRFGSVSIETLVCWVKSATAASVPQ